VLSACSSGVADRLSRDAMARAGRAAWCWVSTSPSWRRALPHRRLGESVAFCCSAGADLGDGAAPRMTLLIALSPCSAPRAGVLSLRLPWDSEDRCSCGNLHGRRLALDLLAIGISASIRGRSRGSAPAVRRAGGDRTVLAASSTCRSSTGLRRARTNSARVSTITLVVREIERALEPNSPHART